jgi:hypothetical protein
MDIPREGIARKKKLRRYLYIFLILLTIPPDHGGPVEAQAGTAER